MFRAQAILLSILFSHRNSKPLNKARLDVNIREFKTHGIVRGSAVGAGIELGIKISGLSS